MATQYFTPLTSKQKPYIKALAEGKSKIEAKRIARYADSISTHQIEQSPSVKAALARLVRQHVPAHKLSRRIAEGVDAMKTISVEMKVTEEEGKPKISTTQIEVPDLRERREYIKLVGEWGYDMGNDKNPSLTLNNQTNINMPVVNVNFADAPPKALNGNSDNGSSA